MFTQNQIRDGIKTSKPFIDRREHKRSKSENQHGDHERFESELPVDATEHLKSGTVRTHPNLTITHPNLTATI